MGDLTRACLGWMVTTVGDRLGHATRTLQPRGAATVPHTLRSNLVLLAALLRQLRLLRLHHHHQLLPLLHGAVRVVVAVTASKDGVVRLPAIAHNAVVRSAQG